jgi:hypothetical protein
MVKLLDGMGTAGMALLALAQQMETLMASLPHAITACRRIGADILLVKNEISSKAQAEAAKVEAARSAGAPKKSRKDVQ